MIVIYTQDEKYIRNDSDAAKSILTSVYEEKLRAEAYAAVKDGREGAFYRKHGRPLVRVVSKGRAEEIRAKEMAVGMTQPL